MLAVQKVEVIRNKDNNNKKKNNNNNFYTHRRDARGENIRYCIYKWACRTKIEEVLYIIKK